jgi:F5/8 type C domain-containing protein
VRRQTIQSPDSACGFLKFFLPHRCLRALWPLLWALLGLSGYQAQAQGTFNVFTRNYNNQRTGANLSESTLNTSNVNSSQFGKLFSLMVDDQVYAGVLYVSSLQIAGGTHNVIYVATVNNTVYAFDADTLGPPLWSRNFNGIGQPSNNSEVGQNCGNYNNFLGNIGIVGTPVIDGSSLTIYFVTRTVENEGTVQRLRALDITTGFDRANSPQVIQANVSGTGDGGTTVVFNPVTQNQRPALALSQGVVYIGWASYCDTSPYHGWVMAYNETSLAQVGVFNDSPNGAAGGIWMAGAGPTFDAGGNVYYPTGNGSFDGVTGFGESLVKLAPGSLSVLDYFTPSTYNNLNANDLDFGSAGSSMLPGTSLVVQGGKTGVIYLLNTNGLLHEVSGDTQIPQFFQAVDTTIRPSATHHIHNASPVWNSPEGLNLYVWGENDYLHLFQFNNSTQTFTTTPYATGSILPPVGMPGGMMVLSADGSQSGSGIVWAAVPRNGDANCCTAPGNLYAFNAETVALLWSSTGTGQDLLSFSKGSAPVVANGKTYVGSLSRFIQVYGLNASAPPSQDLALNKTATSSTPCNSSETAAQAVDGSFSTNPWCSTVSSAWLMVDLGAPLSVSRFVVEHAGAGGQSFNLNTVAYNIQVSTDGVNFTTAVNVTGNVDSINTNDIAPTTARYVRLNIVTPAQSGSTSTIYEFQVFAPQIGSSANFTVSAAPSSQSVIAGAPAIYAANAVALDGFNGNVTWSATGLPAGAAANFNPASVSGSGNSTLTITTQSTIPAGTYTITITGTSGSVQQAATATLVVMSDFSIAASPGSQTVSAGTGTSYTATITPIDGFSGSVALSASGLPSGATATFNPSSVSGSGTSTVGITTTSATPEGTFTITITGVSGSLQHTATASLVVTRGNSTATAVNLSSVYNRTGIVTDGTTFSASGGLDLDGDACSANLLGTTVVSQNLALNLGPANAPDAVANATIPLPAGQYNTLTLLATGLNGNQASQSFTVTYTDGTTSVFTQSLSDWFTPEGYPGETQAVTMAYRDLSNGTEESQTFHLYSYTFTLAPKTVSSITLPANGNVVVLAMTLAATGSASNFSIAASPGSQTVTAGSGTSYTITIAAVNGFSGSVALNASGLPTGATATLNPTSVSGSGTSTLSISTTSSTPGGTYTVTITGTSGSLQNSTTTTLVVNGASSTATQVNLSSSYNRSGIVTDGTTFSASGGLDLNGYAYSANLLGSSVTFQGLSFNLGPANAPDAVANATIPLPAGQYSNLALLATGVNGNQSNQSFTVTYTDTTTSVFTQGLSDWYTPQGYSGESKAVTMAYRDSSTGAKNNLTFYLYGYSFALNSAKTVSSITLPKDANVVVLAMTLTSSAPAGDFSISASPGSQTVTVGAGTSYTATLTALNGFSGSVALSASGLPAGASATFNPTSVTGSGTSTVGITTTSTTPAGTYTVTITGTSGSLQHSTTATLVVTDFSLAASPGSQTVTVGAGTTYTATLTDLSGFSGSVALIATGLPTGTSPTFNPTSLSASGSTSTVGITTTSATPAGTYTVTITGTSGSLQHSTTATLVVTDFSLAASPGSQTVTVGAGTSYTATLTDLSGFSGSVALSATGLPTGASATFNPTSLSGSGSTSTVGITTTSTTPAGTYSVTITGTSGSLQHSTTATLVVTDFSLAASPGSQTVTAGSGTSYAATLTALDGFSGSVALSASGLPTGASATFNPSSVTGSGTSTVGITTTSATPAGTYTVTITGSSGSLQHSTTTTLVVNGGSATTTQVNLSTAYNRTGIVTDGTTFSSTGGLDFGGGAYSATLLGSTVTFQGLSFGLGPANAPDSVSSATIALPAGQYSTLSILATGVNGNQPSQTFIVKYTDGTTSTFAQNLSDWFTPQSYAGESVVATMAYRDMSNGTKDNQTFYLYGYSFTLNSAKTVSSIALPNNANVVLLAVVLTNGVSGPWSLSSAYNVTGMVTDGTTFPATGGLDLNGYAYSANLLGSSVMFQGLSFGLGPANAPDAVSNATIALPAGQYSTLAMLATAVNGNRPNQTFTVTYTDGTTSVFTQGLSDWFTPQAYIGESQAVTMAYRDASNGSKNSQTFYLYGYSFTLNSAKTVMNIALPNSRNVVVLSMLLNP